MTHASLMLVLLVGSLAPTVAAQQPRINIGERHTMRSEILGEERELRVYLPNGYRSSPERRYPLFVVLDGRMNFELTASTIHSLSEGGALPRSIVVGVVNTNRWRDLTPVEGMGIPGTGGGEAFLAFVESELIPHVDATWRTNGFRTISGHSLGGLTVLHTLLRAPALFDAYIALSPSLEWGDGYLVDQYEGFLREGNGKGRMLYLSIADEQMERIPYDRLARVLQETAPEGLTWTSDIYEENDDHMTIRVTGGLAGIRWVFHNWRLTSNRIFTMTDEEIEAHFARASRRYKEPRALSMMDVTNAGYWGLYDPRTTDRAMELFQRAIAKWPESAYPVSCLGEGLERTGEPGEALEVMERALQMAKDTGEQDLPYYQGMVDRVRKALAREDG